MKPAGEESLREPSKRACIALDFDGVIHQSVSPWTDSHEIHDEPVPGALDFIRRALDAGFAVAIHTARANTVSTVPHVHAWLRKHGLEERYAWQLQVTALKPAAVVYIDDRGWRFDGTWPSLEAIRGLQQWNKAPPSAAVDALDRLGEPYGRIRTARSEERWHGYGPPERVWLDEPRHGARSEVYVEERAPNDRAVQYQLVRPSPSGQSAEEGRVALDALHWCLDALDHGPPPDAPLDHTCGDPNASCDGDCMDRAHYAAGLRKAKKAYEAALRASAPKQGEDDGNVAKRTSAATDLRSGEDGPGDHQGGRQDEHGARRVAADGEGLATRRVADGERRDADPQDAQAVTSPSAEEAGPTDAYDRVAHDWLLLAAKMISPEAKAAPLILPDVHASLAGMLRGHAIANRSAVEEATARADALAREMEEMRGERDEALKELGNVPIGWVENGSAARAIAAARDFYKRIADATDAGRLAQEAWRAAEHYREEANAMENERDRLRDTVDAAEKRASAAEAALASYPPRSAVGSGTHWVQQEELEREKSAHAATRRELEEAKGRQATLADTAERMTRAARDAIVTRQRSEARETRLREALRDLRAFLVGANSSPLITTSEAVSRIDAAFSPAPPAEGKP